MRKKLLSFLIAICMIIPCAFMLVACNKGNKTAKVMTLELNPEIEFVLDKDDKVVTVNALNEDGYAIITAGVDFSNLSAEDAAELFIKTAKEQGFVIEGSQEEITISISGETVNSLFNSVKNSMNDYLQSVNITTISFDKEVINKDDLVDAVEECFAEYSESSLKEMSEEELIAMLETSRQETKTFVNEDLKELYYSLREQTILTAKLEAATLGIETPLLIALKDSIDDYKNEFINTYLNPESEYALELKNYVEAKKALLDDKLQNLDLSQAQEALNSAVTALENIADSVKGIVDETLNSVKGLISEVETAITNALQSIPAIADSINTKVNQALETLKTNFTTGELTQYNVSYWTEQPAA